MHYTTVLASDQLGAARALASGVGQELAGFLLDQPIIPEDRSNSNLKLHTPSSLEFEHEFELLASIYEPEDLAIALAPLLLERLLEENGSVIYLAPDTELFSPLEECYEALEESEIVLTHSVPEKLPHDNATPVASILASYGRISPAFIALRKGSKSKQFLTAWKEYFLKAKAEPSKLTNRVEFGAWLDTATPVMEGLRVLDHPGYDVGWWNLFSRRLTKENGNYQVDGSPLRFMRFKDFDPSNPDILSPDQNRIRLSDNQVLGEIYSDYATKLAENKNPPLPIPNTYETLADGTYIDRRLRVLYRRGFRSGELTEPLFSDQGTEEFYAWLNEPARIGSHAGVTRYLESIYDSRLDLREAYKDLTSSDAENFIEWAHLFGRDEMRIPTKLIPPEPEHIKAPHAASFEKSDEIGVNIAGYFQAECGVGEAARLLIQGLDAASIPALPYQDRTVLPCGNGVDFQLVSNPVHPYSINVLCMNGDGIARFGREEGYSFLKGRYNIALWWWEVVGGFPPAWHESFQYLDEVWVASEHIYNAVAPVSPVPVTRIKLPLVTQGRSTWPSRYTMGLDGNEFKFLYIYDYHSIGKRKNPEGLIKAYKQAFPDEDSGTALVLKCINGENRREAHERMLYEASERADIHVIEDFLSAEDKDALVASCDCYVSLHRSEGLGLTPVEAMLLEKPVIATRYGGTLEFMTDENSYLVDYEMVDVGQGAYPYPPTGRWADPDIDQAAKLMCHVFENQDEARAKGKHAARDLRTEHSPEVAGQVMRERLEVISTSILPKRLEEVEQKQELVTLEPPPGKGFRKWLRRALMKPVRKAMQHFLYKTQERLDELGRRSEELERGLYKERAYAMADVRRLTGDLNQLKGQLNQLKQKQKEEESNRQLRLYLSDELTPKQFTHPVLGTVLGYQGNGNKADKDQLYAAFEGVFRGPKYRVQDIQRRYLPLIDPDSLVVDVGCGRGELLDLLTQDDIDCVGVDIDEGMVKRCRESGLNAHHADANTYLESQKEDSIGTLIATEVIEHMPYDELTCFLELAFKKLKAGGLFIAETVNPYCESALKAFWVDPTHKHPLFPESMLVLLKNSGFSSTYYFHPLGSGDIEKDRYSDSIYAVVGER